MTDILEEHIAELMELTDTTTASKIIALIGETRQAIADLVAAALSTDVNKAAIAEANFRLGHAVYTAG